MAAFLCVSTSVPEIDDCLKTRQTQLEIAPTSRSLPNTRSFPPSSKKASAVHILESGREDPLAPPTPTIFLPRQSSVVSPEWKGKHRRADKQGECVQTEPWRVWRGPWEARR